MRLIDADSLNSFFHSSESGIEETLSDLIYRYIDKKNLVMDEYMAYDMLQEFISMIGKVIDTEPTVEV